MRKWSILKGDKIIWIIILFLSMISIVAVFSSSTILANRRGVDYSKINLFTEQLRSVLLGFGALLLCYLIPLKWYRRISFIFFGGTTLMLLIVLVQTLAGKGAVNEANRGLHIFGKTVQVFEFAKVGLIMYLARALELWEGKLNTFKDYCLKLLLPIAVTCILIIPNSFSSAILFGFISLLIMLFMRVKVKYLIFTILIAGGFAAAGFGIYSINPEKMSEVPLFNRFGTVMARIERWKGDDAGTDENGVPIERVITQKEKDELRQSENAKIAISQGGIIGKGPGKSTQRYSLSLAFSDFIFAFIVEEYGLIGGVFVIMLYLVLMFRCVMIAVRCNTPFSSTIVLGLAFLIGTQAFLHIFVNTGIFPVTGHTLPLISHGGTAYIVLSGAFGIILSISKQLDKQDEKNRAEREAAKVEEDTFSDYEQ